MKIKKGKLIEALEISQRFTSKDAGDLAICKTVMIDGPGGRIVATDLEHRSIVTLVITDFMQTVEIPKHPVVFDPELQQDLESLTKAQLEKTCEYAGVTVEPEKGKKITKALMVEAIFMASTASAEAEAEKPIEKKPIGEIFCVDPKPLLKMVKSLKEIKMDEDLEIQVQEFFPNMYSREMVPYTINVGDHFQSLRCLLAEEFPSDWNEFETTPYLKISGDQLALVTAGCLKNPEASHHSIIVFDHETQRVASTDGSKLHLVKAKLKKKNGTVQLRVPTCRGLAAIAKEDQIEISVDSTRKLVLVEYGDTQVYAKNDDAEFPNYTDLLEPAGSTFTLDAQELKDVLAQAKLLTNDMYKGLVCTFNGSISAKCENPDVGVYERFKIPINGKVDPEVEIMLGVEKLQTAIAGLSDDNISMAVLDKDHPIHVWNTDHKFQAVIMPMRV